MFDTPSPSDRPSPLLDRFADRTVTTDVALRATRSERIDHLKRSIVRDVGDLLNTRTRCLSYPARLVELDNSMVAYGLPDFGRHAFATAAVQQQLRDVLRRVIGAFEPRLSSVSVALLSRDGPPDGVVRFRIDGQLNMVDEWVAFVSEFSVSTGRFARLGELR